VSAWGLILRQRICGFDGCAIFSGEVRDPRLARTILRSVWPSASERNGSVVCIALATVTLTGSGVSFQLLNRRVSDERRHRRRNGNNRGLSIRR
jgi:hypothetical protein